MDVQDIVKGETYAVNTMQGMQMIKVIDLDGWGERSEYPYVLTPVSDADTFLGLDLTEGESELVLVEPDEVVSTWAEYDAIESWLHAEKQWLRVESETRWNRRDGLVDVTFKELFAEMGLELTRVDFESWSSEIGFQVRPSQLGNTR